MEGPFNNDPNEDDEDGRVVADDIVERTDVLDFLVCRDVVPSMPKLTVTCSAPNTNVGVELFLHSSVEEKLLSGETLTEASAGTVRTWLRPK